MRQYIIKQSIAQNKKMTSYRSGIFLTETGIDPSSSLQMFVFCYHSDPFRCQYCTHTDISYEIRGGDSKK